MEITVQFPRDAIERIGTMQQNGYLDGTTPFEEALDEAVTSDTGQRVLFNLQETLPVVVPETTAAAFLKTLYTDVWDEGRTIDDVRPHIQYGSARAHANLHAMELSSAFHDEYRDDPQLADYVTGQDDLAEIYKIILDETVTGRTQKGRLLSTFERELGFSEELGQRIISSWTVTDYDKTRHYVLRPKMPSTGDTVNEEWQKLFR